MEEGKKVKDIESYLGRLEIPYDLIMDLEVDTVKKIMSRLVILDAEHNFINNKITYTALSDEFFIPVGNGEVIPYYDVIVDQKDKEETKIEIRRRD